MSHTFEFDVAGRGAGDCLPARRSCRAGHVRELPDGDGPGAGRPLVRGTNRRRRRTSAVADLAVTVTWSRRGRGHVWRLPADPSSRLCHPSIEQEVSRGPAVAGRGSAARSRPPSAPGIASRRCNGSRTRDGARASAPSRRADLVAPICCMTLVVACQHRACSRCDDRSRCARATTGRSSRRRNTAMIRRVAITSRRASARFRPGASRGSLEARRSRGGLRAGPCDRHRSVDRRWRRFR